MRRGIPALLVTASLAGQPACVHHQLTNKQVGIGAIIAVGVTGLVLLMVHECAKGPGFCNEGPLMSQQ